MKQFIAASTLLVAFGIGHGMAQDCSTAASAGLTPVQIKTLVAGNYACVGSSPHAQWNELHTGNGTSGSMVDYKLGPTDPVDPSATVGTYRVATGPGGGGQSPGLINYTYGSGTYGYYIVANLGATFPNPGTYSFCGFSGGAPQLAVTISPTHC